MVTDDCIYGNDVHQSQQIQTMVLLNRTTIVVETRYVSTKNGHVGPRVGCAAGREWHLLHSGGNTFAFILHHLDKYA